MNVNNKEPCTYRISSYDGKDIILGSFYNYELLKTASADTFLVEKILKRKKDKVLVQWMGYPGQDSWIPAKDALKN